MAPRWGTDACMLELAKMPTWASQELSPEALLRGVMVVVGKGSPWSLDPGPGLMQPPAHAAHTAKRVFIPREGGADVPAWWLVPKQHDGRTVLFLHGTSAHTITPNFMLVESMLNSGLAVCFPELDGHGENPEALRPERLREMAPAVWDWLRQQEGVDPQRIGAMGVSLGASCAVRLAAELEANGKPLTSVVLFSPPSRLNFDDWARMAEALGFLAPENTSVLSRATPDRLLRFLLEPIRVACGADGAVLTSDELNPRVLVGLNLAVKALDPLGAAAGLRTPLCVVGGEWDNLTPIYQMVDHYARAEGPKALHLVPRRNHFTIVTSPRALGAAVDWLRRWF